MMKKLAVTHFLQLVAHLEGTYGARDFGDEVILSKTVISNFCPKQVNEWIGGPRASLFQLFIAFLT
jgi:hypothetical protein